MHALIVVAHHHPRSLTHALASSPELERIKR
ncbi:hypothetical protein ACV33E_30170, partial [Pseudomonas aeruginosa]